MKEGSAISTLLEDYDAVFLDLDGTVLRGSKPIPGVSGVLEEVRQAGRTVQFITNNASRSPDQVASYLRELGLHAEPAEVLTSGQAAVAILAAELPDQATVLVIGTEALVAEARSAGLRPVSSAADHPAAVLQGYSPDTGWRQLTEGCLAIRNGARWVACNVDRTLPTERGLVPGNGAMVAALRAATDREPTVAGKPTARLLDTAMRRTGARRPLVVGDRLDTDIAGACRAGLDSLLVLSGVSDVVALLAAPAGQRPVYLGADLRSLRQPADELRIRRSPGWRAEPDNGTVVLSRDGAGDSDGSHDPQDQDPLDAVRTLCAVQWAAQNQVTLQVRAGDEDAAAALGAVGLDPVRLGSLGLGSTGSSPVAG